MESPVMVTLSCLLRTSLPTISYADASRTREAEEDSSAPQLPETVSTTAGGFTVESSVTITSPTKAGRQEADSRKNKNLASSAHTSAEDARRALRRHRKRLARIVVDQWMYAARHRLLVTRLKQLEKDQLMKECVQAWRTYRKDKQNAKKAQELRLQSKKRRSFKKWVADLNSQRERKAVELDAVRKLCQNKLKAAWNSWTRFLKRKRPRSQESESAETDEEDAEAEEEEDDDELLEDAFRKWTEFWSAWKRAKDQVKLADRHFNEYSLRKVFVELRRARKSGRKVKLAHKKLAEDHWRFREIRKSLQAWLRTGRVLRRAMRDAEDRAIQKRANWLLVTAFQAWEEYASGKSERKARAVKLTKKVRNLRKTRVWNRWMRIRDVLKLARMNEELADHLFQASRMKAAFHAWLRYFKHRMHRGEHNAKADAHFSKRLLRLSLAAWRQHRRLKLLQRDLEADAMLSWHRALEKKVIRAWESWLASKRMRKRDRADALATYKNHLQRWACERILSEGLKQQSVKLQNWLEKQAARLVASLGHVAPFARRWRSHIRKRSKLAGKAASAEQESAWEFPSQDAPLPGRARTPQQNPPPSSIGSLLDFKPFPRPSPRRPTYLTG